MRITEQDYNQIADLVFREEYPGYTPHIVESPHGDGQLDDAKQYAHIGHKYLQQYFNIADQADYQYLHCVFYSAYVDALAAALEIKLPTELMPDADECMLRILKYPPGASSHPHTDFDLFTLMVYRDQPQCFRYSNNAQPQYKIRAAFPQIHYGELMHEFDIAAPSQHEVLPSKTEQHSIVFFALPHRDVLIPHSGQSVGEWLDERKERSRYAY